MRTFHDGTVMEMEARRKVNYTLASEGSCIRTSTTHVQHRQHRQHQRQRHSERLPHMGPPTLRDDTSQTPALSALPEELLETIVSYVARKADHQALANLCLASQQLHRIAQPHLYASIKLDIRKARDSNPVKCPVSNTQTRRGPAIPLPKFLEARTNLANYVRTLRIIHDPYESLVRDEWTSTSESVVEDITTSE
ncbi:hypothetical protein K458DRAFT_56600 [Lentithecium fluviatile CBS 122367]|uniref:Uncharacterized protein n=1 Tax=Lentithecium fluviatile CBS 122367 TaxID=1168545 RepID=A0A6G1IX81_9PLEO|nr:hypothetical protein K458DRAFT_56600 [Lentithecium fluviatile CBS 122367]